MVTAIMLPNTGGMLSGFIVRKTIGPWYESLKKPVWTPPNWAYAPIWTSIYCITGYSSYLVWKDGDGFEGAAFPLTLYGANLALNWSWSPIFFWKRDIKLALYEIMLLWGSTVAMGIAFYHINPLSGYLTIPYIAWNSVAMTLNYAIYRDNKVNPEASVDGKKE
ncbi:hypothetical protein KM043_015102 [Ampulex compressa]|nr:hypothetical protein KM043_015102 [Ampulex compressa]